MVNETEKVDKSHEIEITKCQTDRETERELLQAEEVNK